LVRLKAYQAENP